MSIWNISSNEYLQDESDFQIDVLNELKKKHNIPGGLFELYLFKLALVNYQNIFTENVTAGEDIIAITMMLNQMKPLILEFCSIHKEKENFNDQKC